MPLIRDFESLLSCPRCHADVAVERDGDGRFKAVRCGNAGCCGSKGYPVVAFQPALVAFEESVLAEDGLRQREGASQIARKRSRVKDVARRIRSGRPVAERYAAQMLRRLKESAASPVVLVIGGGDVGYGAEAIYCEEGVRVLGSDIYASPNTSLIADAHRIPLKDASVDGVWIQAVLEHVLTPAEVVAEIHRVLKPGGIVYAETPFLQAVHEGPWDFTRFTESGHRWLFRHFTRIDSGPVQGPGTSLLWAVRYVLAGLFRRRGVGMQLGLALFWWLRLLDGVIPRSFSIDAACGVYFFGTKSEKPITPKQAIAHYQGAFDR